MTNKQIDKLVKQNNYATDMYLAAKARGDKRAQAFWDAETNRLTRIMVAAA